MKKKDGRANNGGKRAGAGRKPKAKELSILETLKNKVDFTELVEVINHQATKEGCKASQKLLMHYGLGKPVDTVINVEVSDSPEQRAMWLMKDADGTVRSITGKTIDVEHDEEE